MLSTSKNVRPLNRAIAWLPLCTMLAAAPLAMAGDDGHVGHAGDIYIGIEDGRIMTGLIESDQVSGETRTFEAEFGDSGVPGFTADPGWEAFPGTFNPNARVGWESLAGLRVWNGSDGFVDGIEESITVSFGPSSFEVGAAASAGFDLAVQPDGGVHRHLSFFLNHPTNSPLPGIYLVEFELYATEGPEHSEPFWIVFNYEDEANHAVAVSWVEANLATEDHDDHDDHDDHGHAGDIVVAVENGHIMTGTLHDGAVEEMRTFESEFGESGAAGYTDEPGWEALPGTFSPDVNVGWNALSGVSLWNGAGFDGSIDESITVGFGPLSFEIGASAVDGFALPVESDGAIHRHLGFTLNHPADAPQTGIYLVELEMYATNGGPEHSEPFWIVFNNGDTEANHALAVDWVKDNLAQEDHDHGDGDDHDHGDGDDHDHGDDDDHDDHGHAGDIVVAVENGHIMTGTLHDGEVEEMRTFESEFGTDGYTDEPGWEAASGTFSSDVNVGWNALSGVSLWNGAGFDGSIDESITVGFGTLSFEIGASAVDGFDLPVESDGAIHRHIGFTLNHPSASPQTGIYLVELEMYATSGGPEHSEPFWIVFNNGDSEANHLLAVDWVKDNLAQEDHDHGDEHCDGDVNGDEHVDVMDLLQLINDWGASGGPSDVNEDGTVNVMDLLVVIDAWGECDH
ncbi:MAG: dockerin type I domain-containing protein [Planctomycetota bacterium]|nr:dockerin type I domain-containing protein [Planctomycetota bacterium]